VVASPATPATPGAPATPFLLVDLGRMRRNVRATAERASVAMVALRPHAKTHKCPEIARLQLASGAAGLTVATIGEAEAFVDHGCDDVLVAYPLWLDDRAALRLRDLADRATVAFGVDSVEAAANAGRLLGDTSVEVLVEVDSGMGRSGCRPADAGEVAAVAARAGLTVRGVFTFPGHAYAPGAGPSAAEQERRSLAAARDAVTAQGVDVRTVSGGSTPSLWDTDTGTVNELRPGVYVFGDAQQWELGTMRRDEIALTVVSTVVSHANGRLVLDAGSKVLGADRASYATGFGRLLDHPDARLVGLSEHHALADLGGAPLPRLGSRVRVVPNHVCAAVNLVDHLWVEETGVLSSWPVTARGRNA
jgi:D-serine deaminase-like pyridoxal phosphate-dependent protein